MKLSIQQLSERSGVPERSIRFYIQKGLIPRPQGETRAAFYTDGHLADLLRVKQWQEAGLSLDAIDELLKAKREAPVAPARAGSIEVRSHLILADGLELVVAPERAGLTQTQVQQLFRGVQAATAFSITGATTMTDRTHITVLLDRTGSMQDIRADVVGGFNAFVDTHKAAPGEATLTLVQFDSQNPYELLYAALPIEEVPELTLAQSSKLAALGEMSAAVRHELNQPLAAMKTYLAGARLLLQRKRPEEALSSFQRIDDLIERMGAITRQLKSYARKGGEAFEEVDLRACVSSALAMMEPQLKARVVKISRALPRQPVMVMADRIRLEQVIINLLRNALDATKTTPSPQIDLLLAAGETATLSVRDNGHGINDLGNIFEPFYTTKKPGEGVGLGLAISSGIVADLGGRLTARNVEEGGAVFEMQLPILGREQEAAE